MTQQAQRNASVRLQHRHGMALLVVMVLTMLVALAAYRFSFYMESQYRLARLNEEQLQARLSAHSGLEYAAYLLERPHGSRDFLSATSETSQTPAGVLLLVGNDRTLTSTANSAAASPAADGTDSLEGNLVWRFSLIAPATEAASRSTQSSAVPATDRQTTTHRIGLENESAKLPVPLLLQWEQMQPGRARLALLQLPGATSDLIDHWLRLQGIDRANGSSSSSLLADPSRLNERPSSASSDRTLSDQLHWLWYGGDLNQNYRLDPLELQLHERLFGDTPQRDSTMDSNGESNTAMGWQRYLTWTSGQRNVSVLGTRRVNLNGSDLAQLHRDLLRIWPIEWANFIVTIRQDGPTSNPSSAQIAAAVSAANAAPNLSRPSTYQISSLFDLVDAVVLTDGSNAEKQPVRSPFSSDLATASNYLARLLDEACLDDRVIVENVIDISDAPWQVLAAVPGLNAELAQSIVQRRSTLPARYSGTIDWLYTEQLLNLSQLRSVQPYVVGRSDVYSVQSVGFRDTRSPIARYTAVIDARQLPARLQNKQHWHTWDRGFDLNTLLP